MVWTGCLKENRTSNGSLSGFDVLTEITCSGGTWTSARISAAYNSGYMNRDYLKWLDNTLAAKNPMNYISTTTGDIGQRMGAALETGDVNGDGIDDLAVISYGGKNSRDYASFTPTIAVGFGKKGTISIADLSVAARKVKDSNGSAMASPGISIGDI